MAIMIQSKQHLPRNGMDVLATSRWYRNEKITYVSDIVFSCLKELMPDKIRSTTAVTAR